MSLEKLTLDSLGRTEFGSLFKAAMDEVYNSLKDSDLKGKRSIMAAINLDPDEHGFVKVDFDVQSKTPRRKVRSIATFDTDGLKIDTVSGDVRQPDLLDAEGKGPGKVTPISKAQGG